MPRKSYKPEEIAAKLRQVDVLISRGQSTADAVRQIGVTEVTYYRWRCEFGGLKGDQVRRLKELEQRSSIPLRVYVGVRGCDLPEAAKALMRLGVSLFASSRERLADRGAVEAGLKLRPCQMIPPE
jgi:hypothetical protein